MIECGFWNKVSTGVTAIGHLISDICLLSSGFSQQLFYDGGGLGWLYVEVVVNDLSFKHRLHRQEYNLVFVFKGLLYQWQAF